MPLKTYPHVILKHVVKFCVQSSYSVWIALVMQSCYTFFLILNKSVQMIQILLFNDHFSRNFSTTRVDFRLSVSVPGVQTGVSWVPMHGMQLSLVMPISWHSLPRGKHKKRKLRTMHLLTPAVDPGSCLS